MTRPNCQIRWTNTYKTCAAGTNLSSKHTRFADFPKGFIEDLKRTPGLTVVTDVISTQVNGEYQ